MACGLFLAGCSQGFEPHGILFTDTELKELPSMDKTSIEKKFGKPQYTSAFDAKKVYYIGYQTERFYVTPSIVTKKSVMEVVYDDKGVILSIKPIDLKEKKINPSAEQEPNPDMDIDWKAMIGTPSA
jgi:outer membrane protein assembly factor BamE (lipoprotein component of BamABCDE complex)